jgi:hypothetical protein
LFDIRYFPANTNGEYRTRNHEHRSEEMRISFNLLPNIGQECHVASAFDGVFDRSLEGGAGAAPLFAVQFALAGAELFETLHVFVIYIGRPRAALFGAKPATIFSPPP